MTARASVLCFVAVGVLAGCSLFDNDRWNGNDPDAAVRANDPYHTDPNYGNNPDVFGDRYAGATSGQDSILSAIFGNKDNKNASYGGGGAGIGVNTYLWHATLDTVSFMPLASADPFGGVIITDWYSPPGNLNERFKVNIFILGRELRADGVRASVFRQQREGAGQWQDAAVDPKTGIDLENAILTRARQMRLSTTAEK